MKWSVVGLIFLGFIAAVAVAVLVAIIRAGGVQTMTQAPDMNSEVQVIVAVEDLPAMTVVDGQAVTAKKVRRSEAPEKYLSSPLQVIGKVLTVPVLKDQPFASNSFAAEGSGVKLAAALQNGMRAVSVSLTDYSGLYGMLYPGSAVDVLGSFKLTASQTLRSDAVSITLMRDVQVLASRTRPSSPSKKAKIPPDSTAFVRSSSAGWSR